MASWGERPRTEARFVALCHLVAQGEPGPVMVRVARPRRARSRFLMRAGSIGRLTRIVDRLVGLLLHCTTRGLVCVGL